MSDDLDGSWGDGAAPVVPAPCLGEPGAMLVVISGPSGVGKDTILTSMRELYPDPGRRFIVTCTTRPIREGEVDGVSYHFLSLERFDDLRRRGELLEAAQVHGHWYGTPRDQVVDALGHGCDALLKIDVQGARAVRARVPEALLIFIMPPSIEALRGRLRSRATESDAQLALRERDAARELARRDDYDHLVVNETGQIATTARQIHEIIQAERQSDPDRRIAV